MSRPKILLGLTGSIACFKSAALLSQLVQKDYEVKTVATPGALRMIGEATLEGLSGSPVFKDIYESGRAMDHIHLAKWADLMLVCPTTANTLNAMANGITDSAISTLFLAWELKSKPWWIAPAMNQAMWKHPITQRSLRALAEIGVRILEPAEGHQACGDTGVGRMMEPDLILGELTTWREKR